MATQKRNQKPPYNEADCTAMRIIKTLRSFGMTPEAIKQNFQSYVDAKNELDWDYFN